MDDASRYTLATTGLCIAIRFGSLGLGTGLLEVLAPEASEAVLKSSVRSQLNRIAAPVLSCRGHPARQFVAKKALLLVFYGSAQKHISVLLNKETVKFFFQIYGVAGIR